MNVSLNQVTVPAGLVVLLPLSLVMLNGGVHVFKATYTATAADVTARTISCTCNVSGGAFTSANATATVILATQRLSLLKVVNATNFTISVSGSVPKGAGSTQHWKT